MTSRDTEEWQRPWTADVDASAQPPSQPDSFQPDPFQPAHEPTESMVDPVETAPVGAAIVASSAFAPPGSVGDAPGSIGAGSIGPDYGQPAPAAVSPRPVAPPTNWGPADHGPGSPVGSVRPPDTIGTVNPPPAPRRSGGILVGLLAGLLGAILGTGGMYAALESQGRLDPTVVAQPAPAPASNDPVGTSDPVLPGQVPDGNQGNVVPGVARAVLPSVVRIDILQGDEAIGLGSGVVYRADGYIITNEHVVAEADSLEVKLATGESLPAEIIGTDPLNDLAVLKIDRTGLVPVPLRQEGLAAVVGETAIAIGSPFGLDASVTAGVVSAINRDLIVPSESGLPIVIPAVLQTDAAINPGNSGGALVDSSGRLIGINTAILTANGGSQGVGFAISVEQMIISADQLIATGVVRTGFLGVRGEPVTPEIAEAFGLDRAAGAILGEITRGSAADDAGLLEGDIIIEVDGRAIDSMSDLVVVIRRTQPGDTVAVTYLRDGEEQTVDVTLGDRPDNP